MSPVCCSSLYSYDNYSNALIQSCVFAVEKPLESMATSKKPGSSSESSGTSTDSESEGTGNQVQI